MPIDAFGYAVQSAEEPLAPYHFTHRTPRPDDVVIEILYCGVCHSDIHQVRNEWGASRYPMVPGHEIIGRVAGMGNDVKRFLLGDIVAVGCMVNSCQHCAPCEEGLEQYCEHDPTFTYNDVDFRDSRETYGGYADRIVVADKFVLKVPKKLTLSSAAPLLCAGITTYSPLRHWKVGEGHKVGVIGLGGLGHMAIKFAKAFGAEVTLITRSPSKLEEAARLGVDGVLLSTDKRQMEESLGRFDFLIDTIPIDHDVNGYLALLKYNGVHIIVGAVEPLKDGINAGFLMRGRRSIAGSNIGGIAETQEMLNFCAEQGITCDVEVIDIDYINTAYTRMIQSDVKYRFVIDMATLKKQAG